MVQLHPSFRRLLHEYIPRLQPEDLEAYDSLLALRWQLVHKRSLVSNNPRGFDIERYQEEVRRTLAIKGKAHPYAVDKVPYHPPFEKRGKATTEREKIDELIRIVTEAANNTIAPYRKQFDALHELWSARRNLALHQGGILQVPGSRAAWRGFSLALLKYYYVRYVRISTAGVLMTSALKNPSFVTRTALVIATVVSILFGINALTEGKKDGRNLPPPQADSAAVRQ